MPKLHVLIRFPVKFSGGWRIESPEGIEKFSEKLSEIESSSTETYVDIYNVKVFVSPTTIFLIYPLKPYYISWISAEAKVYEVSPYYITW
jgi:hypothetical protein